MSNIFQEFKQFAMRGNVTDMTVGLVVGAGFSKLVTSFVNDVLMPPFGLIFGRLDFSNLYINLSGRQFPSLKAAQAAGAATINVGIFLNNIIDFLIVAFVIFLLIRQINKLKKSGPEAVTTKQCPQCLSNIPVKAKKCAYCTSDLMIDR